MEPITYKAIPSTDLQTQNQKQILERERAEHVQKNKAARMQKMAEIARQREEKAAKARQVREEQHRARLAMMDRHYNGSPSNS